jgi:5-methylcytosine-specific restriction endonuclease McrA
MRGDGLIHAEYSRCVQAGRAVQAECTDHILAVSKGGAFWEASNHQSLCLACNTAKANASEGGFGR